MRRLVVALLAATVVWACARPARRNTADAQPGTPRGPSPRAHHAAPQEDPCRAALRAGEATPLDAQGRPKVQPGAPEPLAFRMGTTHHSAIGREIDRAELWYLAQPEGGCFEVFVDGRLRGRVSTRFRPKARRHRTRTGRRSHAKVLKRVFRLPLTDPPPKPAPHTEARRPVRPPPAKAAFEARVLRLKPGPHDLEIRPVGKGTVRFFGWVLTRKRPGVVLNNLGVSGAQAANLLPGDKGLIAAQYQRLDPALVIVHTGTNDAYDRRLTAERFEKRLTRLLKRLRPAPSPPDCIVVGAPDFGDKHWRKARRLRRTAAMVRRVERKVAVANGCAYWDQYAAMGGRGAIRRFLRARPPWAYHDRVHLTARGYRVLGQLLTDAILKEYADYLKARPRLQVKLPPVDPKVQREEREAARQWPSGVTPVRLYDPGKRALHRFFRALVLIGRKARSARARIVYLGDSHAAGDYLTGELRRRLQLLFGDGGHGFVHAGTPWAGYRRTGLRVSASGPWQYYWLMTRHHADQPTDHWFGLGGVATWIKLPLPPPTPNAHYQRDGGVRSDPDGVLDD